MGEMGSIWRKGRRGYRQGAVTPGENAAAAPLESVKWVRFAESLMFGYLSVFIYYIYHILMEKSREKWGGGQGKVVGMLFIA